MDQSQRFRLERVARGVASEWGILIGSPFPLSNYSYVAPAGPDAVLKISSSDDEESVHEADVLELWAGDGAVRLLRTDRSRRALLLERASPGSDLAALESDTATTIGVDVAARLWRPAATPFRWIGDHVAKAGSRMRPPGPRLHDACSYARANYLTSLTSEATRSCMATFTTTISSTPAAAT